jgi:hypothetical protein
VLRASVVRVSGGRGASGRCGASGRWLALGGAVVALLVAGCGGSSTPKQSPDVKAASSVVKRYLSALASGDGSTACGLMTSSYRAKVVSGAPSKCAKAFSTLADEFSSSEKSTLANATIAAAKITGDTASVTVKGQKGVAELTKQSGRWLISGGAAAG